MILPRNARELANQLDNIKLKTVTANTIVIAWQKQHGVLVSDVEEVCKDLEVELPLPQKEEDSHFNDNCIFVCLKNK